MEYGIGPNAKRWESNAIDVTAKVVCEQCNSGWMSDLDQQSQITMANIILHGSAVSLLPIGIASLAAFAFKTAVVIDSTVSARQHPFFRPQDRKRFALSLDIPRGIQIWLSRFYDPHIHGRYLCQYAKIKAGYYRGYEVYIFTFVAGWLVIQLAAFGWASIAKQPRFTPYFRQGPVWDTVSVPIWPPDKTVVSWPPLKILNDENIQQFTGRFNKVRAVHN